MCGIVGYVGKQQAAPILLEGLRRLEYRGYDSAGLSILRDHSLQTRKRKGKIDQGLALLLATQPVEGQVGIGHTRWATHGPPSDENAHPHSDASGKIALVHNGVIENHERLKEALAGHQFHSSTDSEVLAHLIGEHYASFKAALTQPSGPLHEPERPLSSSLSPAPSGGEGARRAGEEVVHGPNVRPILEVQALHEPERPLSPAPSGGEGARRAGEGEVHGFKERDFICENPLPASEVHPLARAVICALRQVVGTYGIAVVCSDYPGVVVGARRGSPLIVGIGDGENFLASDPNALATHTREVIYLNDADVVTVMADRFDVCRVGTDVASFQISRLEFRADEAERGAFPHFMLKEIFEQPRAVENALRGRLDCDEATAKFGGLNMTTAQLREVERLVIPACGTSWHAALVGEYLMEEFAHIPTEVEYASEFRYRNAPVEKSTLVLVITQSGETADTLAGLREARRRGHRVLAICNVVGSTIAREADGGIYLHAGPEIGVASTKAFTSQLTVLTLLALLMGRIRMLSTIDGMRLIRALEAIPAQMETILAQNEAIKKIALKYASAENFFFLGRRYNFPVALEGALKLKEISYIHAEGYPAAEMKHGPIALIDETTPTVFVIPSDSLYEKTAGNLEEIRARHGPVVAIATEGNERIAKKVDDVIYLPPTMDPLNPLLAAVPLQLLAYHIAVARGCDVDQPRNLAKSVTVE